MDGWIDKYLRVGLSGNVTLRAVDIAIAFFVEVHRVVHVVLAALQRAIKVAVIAAKSRKRFWTTDKRDRNIFQTIIRWHQILFDSDQASWLQLKRHSKQVSTLAR